MLNSSIWPIVRTLYGNEGVLCIPESSSITEAALPDCLVLYPGQFYFSAEMQSVYSATPANLDSKLE